MVDTKMKEALKKDELSDTKPATTDWAEIIINKVSSSPLLKFTLIAVCVLLVVALGVRIYTNLKGPEETSVNQAVLTVAVEEAQLKELNRHLKLTGTVWARDPLTVGAEIGGLRVDSIKVDEGDFVHRNQVLATLNSSVLKAQLDRELAREKRAQANLDKTIQPNRPMDIAKLEFAVRHANALISQEKANILRAKANLQNASQNTVRYKKLRAEGAVSQEDLDNKQTTEDTFRADLANAEEKLNAAKFAKRQAEESLKLAHEGGSREDVSMAEADLAESKANIKHIRAQIEQTVVRAPEDGWITKRHCHIGDISSLSQPFFEMVKNNKYEVRAEVPEDDLAFLAPEQKVTFTSMSNPNKQLEGAIREISPLIDQETRLALARIDVPFDHKNWKPGMFVSGKVNLGKNPCLTVPSKAVIDRDGRKIVFVLKDNKVFARPVKTGDSNGNLTQIVKGLKEGDKVVVTGGGFLKDGDIVRVGQENQ